MNQTPNTPQGDTRKAEGEQARDKGIEKALNSADNKSPLWRETAYNYLKEFIIKVPFNESFMSEDFREYVEKKYPDFPKPPSPKAWGGIMRMAKADEIIIPSGIGIRKDPKGHRGFATKWKLTYKPNL